MQIKINRKVEPERKLVAFVNGSGDIVFRNRDDNYNTVISGTAECNQGALPFHVYADITKEANKIYEGDSITITF